MKTMENPNKTMHKSQRLINHVALVLDGSGSMIGHRQNVVKVTDEQIKHLMEKSEELTQETRVSIYLFHSDSEVDCVIFDQDVMRLPSIESLYKAQGGTPLIDAVIKSQQDLATTSQIYGDHGFLTFVITDGQENTSKSKFSDLRRTMESMPENWTMGFFVPDESSVAYLSRAGVPKDSIVTWDTSSSGGMLQVGQRIQAATSQYLEQRAQGVRGTRSVFSVAKTGADAVNRKTVAASLNPLDRSKYSLHKVDARVRIDEFVTNTVGKFFVLGKGFYQFTKPETIQGNKNIIIVEKGTGQAYEGPSARGLIGLQWGIDAKVKPDDNPLYDIFVQSTAPNRNLIPGTRLLLLK